MYAIFSYCAATLVFITWTCAGAVAASPIVHRPILNPAGVVHRVQACADPSCMDVYSACLETLKPGDVDAECLKKTMQCQEECAKDSPPPSGTGRKPAGNKDAAPEILNRGNAKLRKGNFAGAIADYTHAIELDLEYALAYLNRGLAYHKRGENDRAIADYTHAIELDPEYALAYLNRGLAYRKKGEHDRAIADYSQAISLKPNYVTAYNARAWAYFKWGKAAKGLPDAENSVRIDPKHYPAWDTLGAIHEALGDRTKAVAAYRKANSLDPKHEMSLKNLKRLGALATSGAYKKTPKEAAAPSPAIAETANVQSGNDFDCQNKSGEASIRACTRIIETKQFNGRPIRPAELGAIYSNRGTEYLNSKQYDRAIPDLRKGLSLAPTNKTIRDNLATAYRDRGTAYDDKKQYRKAIADFRAALKFDPNDAFSDFMVFSLEISLSGTKTADRKANPRDALKNKNNYSEPLFFEDFHCEWDLGEWRQSDKARNKCTHRLKIGCTWGGEPTEAIIACTLLIEFRNRGYSAYLNAATIFKMDLAEQHVHRGNAYLKVKLVHAAINDYRTALEINPSNTEARAKLEDLRASPKLPAVTKGSDCSGRDGAVGIAACTRIIDTGKLNGELMLESTNWAIMHYNRGAKYFRNKQFKLANYDFDYALKRTYRDGGDWRGARYIVQYVKDASLSAEKRGAIKRAIQYNLTALFVRSRKGAVSRSLRKVDFESEIRRLYTLKRGWRYSFGNFMKCVRKNYYNLSLCE